MDFPSRLYRLKHGHTMRCQARTVTSFGEVFRSKQDQAVLVRHEVEVAPYAKPAVCRKHDRYVVADTACKLACLGTDGQDDRSDQHEQDIGALRERKGLG